LAVNTQWGSPTQPRAAEDVITVRYHLLRQQLSCRLPDTLIQLAWASVYQRITWSEDMPRVMGSLVDPW